MVKIRLSRVGKKNYSAYRIVITPEREKRDSKAIEIIGTYDPNKKEYRYKIDAERAKYWLGVGAQPTETVRRFLVKEGLLAKPKYIKKYQNKPGKKAQARIEQAAA